MHLFQFMSIVMLIFTRVPGLRVNRILIASSAKTKSLLNQLVGSYSSRENIEQQNHYTCISFYKFFPIPSPDDFISDLNSILPAVIYGTIYVANEGINAQLALMPKDIQLFLSNLIKLNSNLLDLDVNYGDSISVCDSKLLPFKKLLLKKRDKVLRDGLGFDLNWNDAGEEVEADYWHRALKSANNQILLLGFPTIYSAAKFNDIIIFCT